MKAWNRLKDWSLFMSGGLQSQMTFYRKKVLWPTQRTNAKNIAATGRDNFSMPTPEVQI